MKENKYLTTSLEKVYLLSLLRTSCVHLNTFLVKMARRYPVTKSLKNTEPLGKPIIYSLYFLNINDALCPPNPKELVIT